MDAVVAIVKAEVPEAFAIEARLNEQVAPLGSPLQDRVTALLNPKFGIAVTVEVAEFPAVTGDGDKAVANNSNSDEVVFKSTLTPVT